MQRALLILVLVLVAGLTAIVVALALKHSNANAGPNPNRNLQPCSDTGDRFTKLQLINHLDTAPDVLVLGSSRARVAMPAVVEQLTGGQAFNAGVQGGGAADDYVFTRLLAQRFPAAKPAYLIFVDVSIAGDAVNPDLADQPLAHPFLGSDASPAKSACVNNGFYTSDGGLAYPPASTVGRAQRVAKEVAQTLLGIPADSKIPRHIAPSSTTYFQKLLRFMNGQGATPVIVLNPIYPTILAEREKYGFPELKAAKAYIAWLHKRYRFIFLNCEDIGTWGGKPSNFWNKDHIDRPGMARMLEYVVSHSDGVLTR